MSTKQVSSALVAALGIVALADAASANMIVNGDFSAGYAFFGSDYFFVGEDLDPVSGSGGSFDLTDAGTFVVTADASNWHPNYDSIGDHTTGDGKMLVANGTPDSNASVWRQFINVDAGPRGGELFYTLTFWARTVFPSSPPTLQVQVDGEAVGTVKVPESNLTWTEFTLDFNWVPPVGLRGNGFMLSLVNLNTEEFGNDFAIDDLVLVPGSGVGTAIMVGAAALGARRRRL